MKTFWVSFCGPIVALYPYTYVLAENEIEAIDIVREKKMLNTHPLNPDFLNKYCKVVFYVLYSILYKSQYI